MVIGMNSESKLLQETAKLLEMEFGIGEIDIETKRKVLISGKDSQPQEFDLRIKLEDLPVIFVEIENTKADFTENVAKYWKWLEKAKNAPEKIILIQIFSKTQISKDILPKKQTAQFIGEKAGNRLVYLQLEINKMDPKTISNAILREIKKLVS